MNQQLHTPQPDLQAAEAAMRDVLRDPNSIAAPDGASLGRMLGHVVNMQEAVNSSPDSHANVAKRLGDFALTVTRMADRHPDAAPELSRLSETLLVASKRLRASLT